jgi:hypothetical protein
MSFKGCAAARDSPVNTAAHLVKRSFLQSLSMFGADSTTMDYPAPIEGTAQFFGLHPRDLRAAVRARESSKCIKLGSCTNVVLMPKGLETSMDSAEWVLEPLLPRDVGPTAAAAATPAAAEVWSPTMWRVKVLSGGDTEVDVNRCAADSGHARTPGAVYEFKNGHVGAYYVPLSECAGIRFEFDWSLVSVRSLVYTYLYTLAQRSCAGTEVPDPAPLTAGIARISEWLGAVKALGAELAAKKTALDTLRRDACPAPSLELVEGWLDHLARPSDASDDEHVRTED